MATVFEKILAVNNVEARAKTQAAIDWYRQRASNQRVTAGSMLTDTEYGPKRRASPSPGDMFLFQYDPKTKETLPYYDMFPLVFPFEMLGDGFLGLNLHYLPPTLRGSLMTSLSSLQPKNSQEGLALSYGILNKYSKFSYFKPCVKRYLYSHVRSEFLYVSPEEWPIAIFLPLQQFKKASSGKVYADSRASLGLNLRKKK